MEIPNIETKVQHSQSNTAWNVIGIRPGTKHKIARVPYIMADSDELSKHNREEARTHAEYISDCFNNPTEIKTFVLDVVNKKKWK